MNCFGYDLKSFTVFDNYFVVLSLERFGELGMPLSLIMRSGRITDFAHIMWTTLLDYSRNHWYKLLQAYLKPPEVARPNFNDNFDL